MENQIKPFEKLSDAFNTEFDNPELNKEMKQLEVQKNKIDKIFNSDEWTLEDKQYLQNEIKNTIDSIQSVMDILKNDIKLSTPPRAHEVYATLAKTKLEAIKELRELNKNITDLQITKNKIEGKKESTNNIQVNNYNLNSTDMLKLAKEAIKNSQVKKIKPEFHFDESKDGFDQIKMEKKKS